MTTMLEQGRRMLRGEQSPPPIARLLGFVMKSIEPGLAVFEIDVDERRYNPMLQLSRDEFLKMADDPPARPLNMTAIMETKLYSCPPPPFITEVGFIPTDQIEAAIEKVFDLRPAAIIKELDLRRPIYQQTASYGHFGRTDIDLPWEHLDKVDALKAAVAAGAGAVKA